VIASARRRQNFNTFLCMQEPQHALSLPTSPIRGDGDAAASKNSRGDIPVSGIGQQAHGMGSQVLSPASSIFFSNSGRH
jgi:hypothetical protein